MPRKEGSTLKPIRLTATIPVGDLELNEESITRVQLLLAPPKELSAVFDVDLEDDEWEVSGQTILVTRAPLDDDEETLDSGTYEAELHIHTADGLLIVPDGRRPVVEVQNALVPQP